MKKAEGFSLEYMLSAATAKAVSFLLGYTSLRLKNQRDHHAAAGHVPGAALRNAGSFSGPGSHADAMLVRGHYRHTEAGWRATRQALSGPAQCVTGSSRLFIIFQTLAFDTSAEPPQTSSV